MKWADRAKKILESPKTRTDITDRSHLHPTYVGSVGAPFKAFPEKNADGETSVGSVGSTFETSQEKNENAGAERPLSFEPLPGRYWLDPVLNCFLSDYKTMADLSECKGYPQACPRCRLSMVSGQCLLGPEGGDV